MLDSKLIECVRNEHKMKSKLIAHYVASWHGLFMEYLTTNLNND